MEGPVELEITPQPTEDERSAILAALEPPAEPPPPRHEDDVEDYPRRP